MPVRPLVFLCISMFLASSLTIFLAKTDMARAAESDQESRAFVPRPPKGKGDKCVADTDFMRRYHMTMLNHQRDGTVHEGKRVGQFSLKACIDCHAVQGPDARPVTAKNPKHFCRGCHDYAAVKIDCFECHASRPEPGKEAGLATDKDEKMTSALAGYLEGGQQ